MSHAVLPGIAIGALLSGSLNSPLLVVIATLMGLVVVIGAGCLARTGLVTGDASQGLIFPVLFSIGVILLSTVLTEVHIDESTILAGNINLQALSVNHIVFGTIDIGPITMWKEIVVCAITAIVLFAMRRVLAVATFDPQLARTMGLPVRLTNGILMCLIALTVVVCFDAVGSILVVALMIAPPATALLMAKTLRRMDHRRGGGFGHCRIRAGKDLGPGDLVHDVGGLRCGVPGCAGRYEHRDAHSTAFPGQETSPDRGSSSRQSGSVDQGGSRRCTVLTSCRATDDRRRLPGLFARAGYTGRLPEPVVLVNCPRWSRPLPALVDCAVVFVSRGRGQALQCSLPYLG